MFFSMFSISTTTKFGDLGHPLHILKISYAILIDCIFCLWPKSSFVSFYFHRGVSSTVRRCVEKVSGTQYAVKIIDLTGEKDNEWQMNEIRDQTRKEITILRMCAQHPHISMHPVVPDKYCYWFTICKENAVKELYTNFHIMYFLLSFS